MGMTALCRYVDKKIYVKKQEYAVLAKHNPPVVTSTKTILKQHGASKQPLDDQHERRDGNRNEHGLIWRRLRAGSMWMAFRANADAWITLICSHSFDASTQAVKEGFCVFTDSV
jgi:hypothetical protein